MPLTDVVCRTKKPGPSITKLSDGGGLQLWVQPNGSRLWRLAYRFGGKQKLLALGAYPTVTLAEARHLKEQARKKLAAGEDPSSARRAEKIARASAYSFAAIAEEYIAKRRREGKAPTTISKNEWLLSLAAPALGSSPVDGIKPIDVLSVLRKIEHHGHYETARRLRAFIGGVFRYAVATARADADPTFALRDALTVPTITPRAALTEPQKVGELMRAIGAYDGSPVTRAALRLMALLFPRPGELRLAEWNEFDLARGVWRIPAERMKMRRPHLTPLPQQALAIVRDLRVLTGAGEFVFPSLHARARPLSENTLNSALRRMGYGKDEATAHGFRSTASTLLNESRKWHPDAIERQLAHLDKDRVRAAYDRADHWDERVRMMQWWANYLDELTQLSPHTSIAA